MNITTEELKVIKNTITEIIQNENIKLIHEKANELLSIISNIEFKPSMENIKKLINEYLSDEIVLYYLDFEIKKFVLSKDASENNVDEIMDLLGHLAKDKSELNTILLEVREMTGLKVYRENSNFRIQYNQYCENEVLPSKRIY